MAKKSKMPKSPKGGNPAIPKKGGKKAAMPASMMKCAKGK